MRMVDYLKDRFFNIVSLLLSIICVNLILILFQTNNYVIALVSLIIIIINTPILIYDLIKRKKFYDNFNKLLSKLDKKYLIHEFGEQSNFIEANILIDYLYEIDKSYNDDVNKYRNLLEEFKDYLELWCHEIKTPIATSKLVLLNEKNSSVDEELSKIEYYVEQVMFYARSENVEKDYIINETSLKKVINESIKNYKKQILSNKIKIKKFDNDVCVESDSKWLIYIVSQIISNSIKYIKNDGVISFNYYVNKNNIVLSITDNGIGISFEDQDRIFDKGFTGKNGRINKYSTGMGLYLVKKLCDKLGHDILVESKENEYTTFKLVFPINIENKNLTKS